jgi:hypothetical protein
MRLAVANRFHEDVNNIKKLFNLKYNADLINFHFIALHVTHKNTSTKAAQVLKVCCHS